MIQSMLQQRMLERPVGVSLQEIENLYTLQVWEVYLVLLRKKGFQYGDRKEQREQNLQLVGLAEEMVSDFNEWDSERSPAL